jgi:hypothetical protein
MECSARVRPRPEFPVDVGVTKDPWRAGCAGGREHHPAALGPDFIIHGRIGAVGRVRGGVLRHFLLVDDRPFRREVADRLEIGRQQAKPIKAAAVKITVLIEERRDRPNLVVLDCSQLVARGRIQAGRPIIGRAGRISVVPMALDCLKPRLPRRRRAICCPGHGPPAPFTSIIFKIRIGLLQGYSAEEAPHASPAVPRRPHRQPAASGSFTPRFSRLFRGRAGQ